MIQNDIYYKINTNYNIIYPIGSRCQMYHLMRPKNLQKKDRKYLEIIPYYVPGEMCFFYYTILSTQYFVLKEFFNGNFIKRICNKAWSFYYKDKNYTTLCAHNIKGFYDCAHLETLHFPIKYLLGPKYIQARYNYFLKYRYNFFYPISMTWEFGWYTNEMILNFEDYLIKNNFNLQNFLYIDFKFKADRYKNTKIKLVLIDGKDKNIWNDDIDKCMCPMCRFHKIDDNVNYCLEQVERIKKSNINDKVFSKP